MQAQLRHGPDVLSVCQEVRCAALRDGSMQVTVVIGGLAGCATLMLLVFLLFFSFAVLVLASTRVRGWALTLLAAVVGAVFALGVAELVLCAFSG